MRLLAAAIGIGIGCPHGVDAAPPVSRSELVYTEAPRFDAEAARAGGERFPSGARLMLWTPAGARPLVPAFSASADPAISFDATRILFSGKRSPGDPWRIWELPLASGRPRQVTFGDGDCLRPLHLPLQKVVYARRTSIGTHLEIAPLTGGSPSRLTFVPGHFLPAVVLRDGRILYEAGELFTVYTDGSGVESYRCDHGPTRFAASQLSSGDIVFQFAGGLARFTSARAVQLEIRLPQGEYFGPVAESAGRWLVACRGGICAVTPGSEQSPSLVVRGSAWQPVPVEKRPVPPYHPSSLGESESARLLCLDAYESKAGRLPANSVAAVRLWSRTATGETVALGQTQVDPDGSFFVQVPGDRPLRFELLDRAGRVLRAEKNFFWARPGEQRVCVGCHTGPERAPGNRVPGVLERIQTPVPLGGR